MVGITPPLALRKNAAIIITFLLPIVKEHDSKQLQMWSLLAPEKQDSDGHSAKSEISKWVTKQARVNMKHICVFKIFFFYVELSTSEDTGFFLGCATLAPDF